MFYSYAQPKASRVNAKAVLHAIIFDGMIIVGEFSCEPKPEICKQFDSIVLLFCAWHILLKNESRNIFP